MPLAGDEARSGGERSVFHEVEGASDVARELAAVLLTSASDTSLPSSEESTTVAADGDDVRAGIKGGAVESTEEGAIATGVCK